MSGDDDPSPLEPDTWSLRLEGARVVATSVGAASYADLADGSLGTGHARDGDRVDLAPVLPEWVNEVLAAQASTGYEPARWDATEDPTIHPSAYEFGRGNCHGFATRLFGVFDDEPIEVWQVPSPRYDHGRTPAGREPYLSLTSPPPGAPRRRLADVDPRYQVVVSERDAPDPFPPCTATFDETNRPADGMKWWTTFTIVYADFVRKLEALATRPVTAVGFGDLGLGRRDRGRGAVNEDHSLLALSGPTRGGLWVYTLQKMAPFSPYTVRLRRVSEYRWYHLRDRLR